MTLKLIIIIWLLIAVAVYYFVEYRNYKRHTVPFLAFTTIIGGAITHIFLFSISNVYSIYPGSGYGSLDMVATGQVGDFIGGVIGTLLTGLSIILLYKTLKAQNNSSIENRFFELLKFHRENVNEIEFTYTDNEGKEKIVRGRQFFVSANKQINQAFNEFDKFFNFKNIDIEAIYNDKFLEETKNNIFKERNFENLYLITKIDLCYLILFFGVSQDGRLEILKHTADKYNSEFISELTNFFRMKPSRSSEHFKKWQSLINGKNSIEKIKNIQTERKENNDNKTKTSKVPNYYPDNYDKFYGGHRFRLGHYYRHLFQMSCFVHYHKDLTNDDKIAYMRILRGQLSDYEQILFFYNSISQLGRDWEITDSNGKSVEKKNRLITTYKIIKSISSTKLVNNLEPQAIYPIRKS